MRGKARTWGVAKTCTIVCDQHKWYASITVECAPQRQTGTGAVGLDFGSKTAIATSDGELIDSPKFLNLAQSKISQLSKGLRRRRKPEKRQVKASNRWKKTQARISKIKRQVANQRADWTHKVAAQIVSSNSMVATEKLNLKGMTRKAKKGSKRKRQKTGLNRNLLDVAIGMLRESAFSRMQAPLAALTSSIKYKVIEAGGVFLEAPTQKLKPTQRCNECWELTPKTLSDRLHICSHCGHVADRDINSAQVCLTWARGKDASLVRRRFLQLYFKEHKTLWVNVGVAPRRVATWDIVASETLIERGADKRSSFKYRLTGLIFVKIDEVKILNLNPQVISSAPVS